MIDLHRREGAEDALLVVASPFLQRGWTPYRGPVDGSAALAELRLFAEERARWEPCWFEPEKEHVSAVMATIRDLFPERGEVPADAWPTLQRQAALLLAVMWENDADLAQAQEWTNPKEAQP